MTIYDEQTKAWIQFTKENVSAYSGQLTVSQRSTFNAGWDAALQALNSDKEIDRYDPWAETDGDKAYPIMERHPEGDWVKFDAHQQVVAALSKKAWV